MKWNAAMVFTFGNAIPGRENGALQTYFDAQAYFGKLASEDKCEVDAYQWTDGGGMMVVRAEWAADLQKMLEAEDGRKVMAEAALTFQNFTLRTALVGDAASDAMTEWAAVGSELGLMN